jgi:hypothetical protein
MKEASGELNSTVFVILAIGVLMAFFYYVIWPIVRQDVNNNSQCSKAVCEKCVNAAGKPKTNCKTVKCHLPGDESNIFECVYKG